MLPINLQNLRQGTYYKDLVIFYLPLGKDQTQIQVNSKGRLTEFTINEELNKLHLPIYYDKSKHYWKVEAMPEDTPEDKKEFLTWLCAELNKRAQRNKINQEEKMQSKFCPLINRHCKGEGCMSFSSTIYFNQVIIRCSSPFVDGSNIEITLENS